MEMLMQYVWRHRLWPPGDLTTRDGRRVAVVDAGQQNRDSGPDFFNAKIKIGNEIWCGNVEIHVRASDWLRHGHDRDRAYDSVILHVVEHDDCEIRTTDGRIIPQVTLKCARDFSQRYADFINNPANSLACASELAGLNPVMVRDWLDAMAFERLYDKAGSISERVARTAGNWEQAVFITLARALGAGINGDNFERLAASLPLRLLHKHADSMLALEAMLFGQAGLLDGPQHDGYVAQLQREYAFMCTKFELRRPDGMAWRMSKMRPASFPHRRIAALAHMVYGGFGLMNRILEVETEADARKLFEIDLTGYWVNHCNFLGPTPMRPRALGRSAIDVMVINVVAPLLIAYGEFTGDESLGARAVDILEHLPGESNRFTADFVKIGVACPNAFISQAMIQARRQYCDVRKCLHCRLGHRLLAAKVKP